MISALLVLVGATGCSVETSTTTHPATHAQMLGALGYERLLTDDLDGAVDCLREAHALDPTSPIYARDLAAAVLESDPVEALAAIEAALANGDPDPEARILRATILAALGRDKDAIETLDDTETWEADLAAAALSDRAAVRRAIPLVDEHTRRGAMASLTLASFEAAEGSYQGAARLAELALSRASLVDAPVFLSASRDLFAEIRARDRPRYNLRLRSSFDHATNPAYLARGREPRRAGLRLAFGVDGDVVTPVGPFTARIGGRIDQHVYVIQRETFDRLDITAFTLAGAITYPLSRHPSLAVLGLSARVVDVHGALFDTHYATTLEGGPDLTLELAAGLRLRLGLYGSAADVIDTSPPDDVVSSLNRDRVGQRAVVTLFGELDRVAGTFSAAFIHDDALGDAFDAIGGELSARLVAFATPDLSLYTGVGVTLREYGPVGDLAIIGPAATRTQLRIVAAIGVRARFTDQVFVVVEDTWVNNQARNLHEYVSNVLSVGAEVVF